MVRRTRSAALVAAAMTIAATLSVPGASAPQAAAAPPPAIMSGWLPYWNVGTANGQAVLTDTNATAVLDDVSFFGTNASTPSLRAAAQAAGHKVFLTIFSSNVADFTPTATRTMPQIASSIVQTITAGGYDGADIDYEFVWYVSSSQWPTITPNWVAFITELSKQMKAAGKLLSVTVPPVWTVNGALRGYTVYAQDQIGPLVDRLRLMVYDWSVSSPGPIAPASWVDSVIAYSTDTANVPPAKLQLGVPAYGRHWWTKKNATETCPEGSLKSKVSIPMDKAAALAALHGATPVRDVSGELKFTWDEKVTGLTKLPPPYIPPVPGFPAITKGSATAKALRLGIPRYTTCTIRHVVYVPDASTIATSAQKAVNRGWRGVSVWAFGYETAATYTKLAAVTVPPPAP